jgi:hypothetical protein
MKLSRQVSCNRDIPHRVTGRSGNHDLAVEAARSWHNLTGWFEGGRRLINRLIPEVCKILAKHDYQPAWYLVS